MKRRRDKQRGESVKGEPEEENPRRARLQRAVVKVTAADINHS